MIKRIIAVLLLFSVLGGFLLSAISFSISSNKFIKSSKNNSNIARINVKDDMHYKTRKTSDYSLYGYSNEDFELMARVISAESRGEPYIGQVAVGAVILNRTEHPSFPDTIKGVVYQKGAFSCIDDGQINNEVTDSAYKAAKEALSGKDPSGGAIYFYNPKTATNKWIYSRTVVVQIGAHVFCK